MCSNHKKTASRWWISVLLMLIYVAAFYTWQALGSTLPILLTIGPLVLVLGTLMVIGSRTAYFVSTLDHLVHLAVILDLLVEGVLASVLYKDGADNDLSFYGCAVAFSVVILLYRTYRLHLHKPLPSHA